MTNRAEQSDAGTPYRWWPLTILFVAVIALWAGFWYFLTRCPLLPSWNDRAAFGDMFGALNTLFSGLAFAALIYALYLQSQELALQRKELEATRRELRRSAEAQERSQATLDEQALLSALAAAITSRMARAQAYTIGRGDFAQMMEQVLPLQAELDGILTELRKRREEI